MRLLTAADTSVVLLDLTEPCHPKAMELRHEVRILVADLTDHLRLKLPCGTQVSSSPQTVASAAGYVLAACSTLCSVA
jgi:hypothetical protein